MLIGIVYYHQLPVCTVHNICALALINNNLDRGFIGWCVCVGEWLGGRWMELWHHYFPCHIRPSLRFTILRWYDGCRLYLPSPEPYKIFRSLWRGKNSKPTIIELSSVIYNATNIVGSVYSSSDLNTELCRTAFECPSHWII